MIELIPLEQLKKKKKIYELLHGSRAELRDEWWSRESSAAAATAAAACERRVSVPCDRSSNTNNRVRISFRWSISRPTNSSFLSAVRDRWSSADVSRHHSELWHALVSLLTTYCRLSLAAKDFPPPGSSSLLLLCFIARQHQLTVHSVVATLAEKICRR